MGLRRCSVLVGGNARDLYDDEKKGDNKVGTGAARDLEKPGCDPVAKEVSIRPGDGGLKGEARSWMKLTSRLAESSGI